MREQTRRVLIAAGGSGGHVIPAVEVAARLKLLWSAENVDGRIQFVGVGRPVETAILKSAGYTAEVIPSVGLKGRGLAGLREFLARTPEAVRKTKQIFNAFSPHVVAGFGGYPTVLPILVGRCRGLPTWIHEADSSAGWATKFLSFFATKVSSGFENLSLPFGRTAFFSGHPIRSGIQPSPVPSGDFLPKRLLVLGGSQGAKSLDTALPRVVESFRQNELQILHQARSSECEAVEKAYRVGKINSTVLPYIEDLPAAYATADIIISRAGAGAVVELSVLNKPIIFVPLPNVSGHQLSNAKTLAREGKALIVEEGEDFENRLRAALAELLDPDHYREIVNRPLSVRRMDAAEQIALGINELAKRKA